MYSGPVQRPLKSSRPCLIKKSSSLLSARLPSRRSSAQQLDSQHRLPGAACGCLWATALGYRPPCQAWCANRCCPLPPPRVAWLMSHYPANSTYRRASILPSNREMLRCAETHVASICFMCFRCFIGMLQLFHADVANRLRCRICCSGSTRMLHRSIFNVSSVFLDVYLQVCFIWMSHTFYTYVVSVLSGYCVCFAMVFQVFSRYFLKVFHKHVSSVSSAFRRVLQALHLDVPKVNQVLHLFRCFSAASPRCLLLLRVPAGHPPRPYSSSQCWWRSGQRGKPTWKRMGRA
jgi:hypothetical protein